MNIASEREKANSIKSNKSYDAYDTLIARLKMSNDFLYTEKREERAKLAEEVSQPCMETRMSSALTLLFNYLNGDCYNCTTICTLDLMAGYDFSH